MDCSRVGAMIYSGYTVYIEVGSDSDEKCLRFWIRGLYQFDKI